ncbi:MAG: AAA family ATPase [Parcubacteria group bacterium]|nr:AAA family ATPase [Parcubacteria group bacterium]
MNSLFIGNTYARNAITEYFKPSGVRSCVLYGLKGLGKFTFLRELVRVHGNQCIVLDTSLTIQMMREIKHFASLSQRGQVVCILDNVDTMNEEAQSAFLKTLEEAPHMVFCIITSNLDALLPTIQSRIPAFYFSPCTSGEMKAFIDGLGSHAEEERTLIIKYSAGRPGIANGLVANIKKLWELDRSISFLSDPNIYKRLHFFHEYGIPLFGENPEQFIDACIFSFAQNDTQRIKDVLELKRILDSNVNPIFQFEHYLATH